jgi:hypothetical protein
LCARAAPRHAVRSYRRVSKYGSFFSSNCARRGSFQWPTRAPTCATSTASCRCVIASACDRRTIATHSCARSHAHRFIFCADSLRPRRVRRAAAAQNVERFAKVGDQGRCAVCAVCVMNGCVRRAAVRGTVRARVDREQRSYVPLCACLCAHIDAIITLAHALSER